jgi:hypothetical protein
MQVKVKVVPAWSAQKEDPYGTERSTALPATIYNRMRDPSQAKIRIDRITTVTTIETTIRR